MVTTHVKTPLPKNKDSLDTDLRLIVISGLSGAGKTVALRMLEDLDYYCVDNLPAALLPSLIKAVKQDEAGNAQRVAVGIDIRNCSADLSNLPHVLAELATAEINHELIFLDTRDEILFKRFSDTRRRHPLTSEGISLADAIGLERKLLRPLIAIADRVIDTSELNVHQLRRVIATDVGASTTGVSIMFESFAYKRGVPTDADFIFDARCLPNPHWDFRLRPLSGRDAAVQDYFVKHEPVQEFYQEICSFLHKWIPRFEAEQRNYVTICVGCTGGRHRSVYIVEKLAADFRKSREEVMSFHRELD